MRRWGRLAQEMRRDCREGKGSLGKEVLDPQQLSARSLTSFHIKLFFFIWGAVLSLRYGAQASLVAACGLNCAVAGGVEPTSSELEGGYFTTGTPGKPL